MRKILIINLDGAESILLSSSFIKSICSYFPTSNISYLTYLEDVPYAKILPIDHFFCLKGKQIASYLQNPLFPPAAAINSLEESIREACSSSWDCLIHLGESPAGLALSSLICMNTKTKNFFGRKFESNLSIFYSSHWYALKDTCGAITHIESLHLGFNLFFENKPQKTISSYKNIGIHLPSNPDDTYIPFQTVIELIGSLKEKNTSFTLLVDLNQNNKEYFLKLNRQFNYDLQITFLNVENVKKVLARMDFIISGPSLFKNIAHLQGIPLLEITDTLENTLIGSNNLILKKFDEKINGSDLIKIMEGGTQDLKNHHLYCCIQDKMGWRLSLVGGPVDFSQEIKRLMSRYLIGSLYLQENDETILWDLSDFPHKELLDFIKVEKSNTNEISGQVLNVLRLLSLIDENDHYKREFVNALDALIANSDTFLSIPLSVFKFRIDELKSTDIKTFENTLFLLKNEIQSALSGIRELENQIATRKREALIKKAQKFKSNALEAN